MASCSPTLVRYVLVIWLTLSFLFSWLPLLRSLMDGTSYEWGTRYFGVLFSGAGLAGDLWLLVVQTALGIWLLYYGWRDPTSPFSATLLVWLGFQAADGLHGVATGGAFHFEGATLGVDVSLGTMLPLLHVGFFCLGLWWVVHYGARENPGTRPAWTGTNTVVLGLAILLFPVQFLLLRSGQGQEANDVAGVLLTILQWFLISAALYPWRRRIATQVAHASAARLPA